MEGSAPEGSEGAGAASRGKGQPNGSRMVQPKYHAETRRGGTQQEYNKRGRRGTKKQYNTGSSWGGGEGRKE
eukprot:scaffold5498_cov102-Isochrysis_galbana.AAC.6